MHADMTSHEQRFLLKSRLWLMSHKVVCFLVLNEEKVLASMNRYSSLTKLSVYRTKKRGRALGNWENFSHSTSHTGWLGVSIRSDSTWLKYLQRMTCTCMWACFVSIKIQRCVLCRACNSFEDNALSSTKIQWGRAHTFTCASPLITLKYSAISFESPKLSPSKCSGIDWGWDFYKIFATYLSSSTHHSWWEMKVKAYSVFRNLVIWIIIWLEIYLMALIKLLPISYLLICIMETGWHIFENFQESRASYVS